MSHPQKKQKTNGALLPHFRHIGNICEANMISSKPWSNNTQNTGAYYSAPVVIATSSDASCSSPSCDFLSPPLPITMSSFSASWRG